MKIEVRREPGGFGISLVLFSKTKVLQNSVQVQKANLKLKK